MSLILGKTETNSNLQLRDIERRNGLYILGKPRMGKSWLLVNMILQDIEKEHGVFFIDPHGDAIDEIMNRRLMINNIFLDPEDRNCSFGINILSCPDITNHALRSDTFAKAKGFFDKIWKNTFEERPWLQLILQNALYALIENQGYTLAELPLFFRDSAFRAFICNNIKYNVTVRDYWLKTFASKEKRDQDAQMEAAQTRLEILLAHPAVRHVVGQERTTIDFQTALDQSKVVLLKFSSAMSIEVKKIIGTLFVSELLSAIQKRPSNKRTLFCIYIDEFQNFASFEDFAVLITQAPKYGISTTLAHHERYGQLLDDHGIAGATSAIVNKIIFQITGKDAHDLAPEFRKEPPFEMRDEDVFVISQYPFYDLLHGHDNPQLRYLVDKCIRPIKYRLEDIYGEKETERLMRMDDLDMAAIHRIDEVIQATRRPQDPSGLQDSLARAAMAVLGATGHTGQLKSLNEEGMRILATVRVFNRLFIDVMEGHTKHCSEDFSNRLIDISKHSTLPYEDRRVLELYIALAYGDSSIPRLIPFECAKRQGMFKEYIAKIEHAINTEYETQRAAFARRVWQIDIESILRENIRMFNEDRRKQEEPECKASEIEQERERLKYFCGHAIEEYERGEMPKAEIAFGLTRLLDLLEKVGKDFKPLVKRQPQDITVRALGQVYVDHIRRDLTTRGYGDIVESIDGVTKLCALLRIPENHLQVKTKQRRQKAVQTRTIADMTNEMEGELTELPKYTAYAKVLNGGNIWKGKLQTLKLPFNMWERHGPVMFVSLVYPAIWKERSWIEEKIQRRHTNWKPTVIQMPYISQAKPIASKKTEEEPPPTRY